MYRLNLERRSRHTKAQTLSFNKQETVLQSYELFEWTTHYHLFFEGKRLGIQKKKERPNLVSLIILIIIKYREVSGYSYSFDSTCLLIIYRMGSSKHNPVYLHLRSTSGLDETTECTNKIPSVLYWTLWNETLDIPRCV